MSSLVVLATTAAADKLNGLEVKYWFGFVLLGVAVLLGGAQTWTSIHPPAPRVDPDDAKKAVDDVAGKARTAVAKAQEAVERAQEAVAHLGKAGSLVAGGGATQLIDAPDQITDFVQGAVAGKAAADQAAQDASDAADVAKKAADDASQTASSTSFMDIASTVATKLPLLGGALLFALLGCAVAGFINISFG